MIQILEVVPFQSVHVATEVNGVFVEFCRSGSQWQRCYGESWETEYALETELELAYNRFLATNTASVVERFTQRS